VPKEEVVVVVIPCQGTLQVTLSGVVIPQLEVLNVDVVVGVDVDEVQDVERARKDHSCQNHPPVLTLIMSEEVGVLKGKSVVCSAYVGELLLTQHYSLAIIYYKYKH
jgi:hypothetical protein